MVRKQAERRKIQEGLAAYTKSNKLDHLAKVDSAMASIERDVKAGKLPPNDVTFVMLLRDRAGVNHRYLDAPGQKTKKREVEIWLAETLPNLVPVETIPPQDEKERLRAEIKDLQFRLERMGDRIHFYSAQIRQHVRTIKSLKAKALETVVHINREQHR